MNPYHEILDNQDEEKSGEHEAYSYFRPLKFRDRLPGDGCLPGPCRKEIEAEIEVER